MKRLIDILTFFGIQMKLLNLQRHKLLAEIQDLEFKMLRTCFLNYNSKYPHSNFIN